MMSKAKREKEDLKVLLRTEARQLMDILNDPDSTESERDTAMSRLQNRRMRISQKLNGRMKK